jgi:ligand-binding SRPBCC domain-containing protein
MPVIELKTRIYSTIEVCFDLSRSIDLHTLSTAKTKEIAIDGATHGLIGADQFVTWEATHFGVRQQLTSKIKAFVRPFHFCDEQVKGPFRKIKHDHFFKMENEAVIMTDRFEFESPLGIFGRLFNKIILTGYLKKFLLERNEMIKKYAEGNEWKQLPE